MDHDRSGWSVTILIQIDGWWLYRVIASWDHPLFSGLVLNWNRQNLVFFFFYYYDLCLQLYVFHLLLFSCICLLSGNAWVRPAAIKVQRRAGLPLESLPSTSTFSIRNNKSTDRTTMIDDSCAKLIIPATIKININFWPGEYLYDDRDQF